MELWGGAGGEGGEEEGAEEEGAEGPDWPCVFPAFEGDAYGEVDDCNCWPEAANQDFGPCFGSVGFHCWGVVACF